MASSVAEEIHIANKAQTLLEKVRMHAGEEAHERILEACGELGEKPTPSAQARCVAVAVSLLPDQCGLEKAGEILRACGHACISGGTIEKAKKLYRTASGLDDFPEKLNREHIGGGRLAFEGGSILGRYERCYCGLAKNAKNLPSIYCDCSTGWFQKLFTSVLGREVAVIRRQTILGGAEECIFEILVATYEEEDARP